MEKEQLKSIFQIARETNQSPKRIIDELRKIENSPTKNFRISDKIENTKYVYLLNFFLKDIEDLQASKIIREKNKIEIAQRVIPKLFEMEKMTHEIMSLVKYENFNFDYEALKKILLRFKDNLFNNYEIPDEYKDMLFMFETDSANELRDYYISLEPKFPNNYSDDINEEQQIMNSFENDSQENFGL